MEHVLLSMVGIGSNFDQCQPKVSQNYPRSDRTQISYNSSNTVLSRTGSSY